MGKEKGGRENADTEREQALEGGPIAPLSVYWATPITNRWAKLPVSPSKSWLIGKDPDAGKDWR